MINTDAVIGMFFGDEAKSKTVAHLVKNGSYTHTLRYNGGHNCGHTFYVGEQRVVTHIVPTGAMLGVRSIIGSSCVLNELSFFKELEEHSKIVPNVASNVRISRNAHIVTQSHIEEEASEQKIGTTRRGVGPAYRDKHARTGIRAESIKSLQPYLIDIYEELYLNDSDKTILCEGAQALGLDINFGDYPYVTSSACGIGEVINNGICPSSIRDIFGVGKVYTTYVGSKQFQDTSDPTLDKIADVGLEIGATTGRRRQVNYLDLDFLLKSKRMSSCTKLILNKLDILRQVDVWKVYKDGKLIDLKSEESFKEYIANLFSDVQVVFSDSPYRI